MPAARFGTVISWFSATALPLSFSAPAVASCVTLIFAEVLPKSMLANVGITQETKIVDYAAHLRNTDAAKKGVYRWLGAQKADVVCLQEIKASLDQLPFELRDVENYWSYWHGEKGYSGVALLVSKTLVASLPFTRGRSFPAIRPRSSKTA